MELSDYGKYVRMLDRAGVIYGISDDRTTEWAQLMEPDTFRVIEVQMHPGEHNHGYVGFIFYHFFDHQGRLLGAGAWE